MHLTLVEVASKCPAVVGMSQLSQRLRLDLPDSLASDAKLTTYFLERPELPVVQSESRMTIRRSRSVRRQSASVIWS
jgi:hypothetical protein